MSTTTSRTRARRNLINRLEQSDWDRSTLVDSIVLNHDLDRDLVEDVLEQLEATGEVYTVNGEVRRTP